MTCNTPNSTPRAIFRSSKGRRIRTSWSAERPSWGAPRLAITDRNSLAGVVRAHVTAKQAGLKLLIGAEITPDDAPPLTLLATDRAAYGRLASLITRGCRRAEKGACHLTFRDICESAEGLLACIL